MGVDFFHTKLRARVILCIYLSNKHPAVSRFPASMAKRYVCRVKFITEELRLAVVQQNGLSLRGHILAGVDGALGLDSIDISQHKEPIYRKSKIGFVVYKDPKRPISTFHGDIVCFTPIPTRTRQNRSSGFSTLPA
jgi:hypothetical protein